MYVLEEHDPDTMHPDTTYRNTSLKRSSTPPQDHHRTLGTVPLKVHGRGVFLMSQVPLEPQPFTLYIYIFFVC